MSFAALLVALSLHAPDSQTTLSLRVDRCVQRAIGEHAAVFVEMTVTAEGNLELSASSLGIASISVKVATALELCRKKLSLTKKERKDLKGRSFYRLFVPGGINDFPIRAPLKRDVDVFEA
jgi:hypothetical protein